MIQKLFKTFTSREFVRFFVVGISAFVVDTGSLLVMIHALNFNPYWQPSVAGVTVSISIANAISIIIALCFNFVLQRVWAFEAKEQDWQNQAIRFTLVVLLTYVLNNLLFGFMVVNLGIKELPSKVVVTGLQMLWSFAMYKYVVFRINGEVKSTSLIDPVPASETDLS